MLEYGFFNAVNGDRVYNADSFNDFFDGILSETGVYKKALSRFEVTDFGGMFVKVQTGMARIRGHWVKLTADKTLTIEEASVSTSRVDAVVIRLDESSRQMSIIVLKGDEDGTNTPPDLLDTVDKKDICLAYVNVAAGATSISTDDIVDKRDDSSVCGYVKLQIDSVNAGIKEYRNTVTLTEETSVILIGINDYDPQNDILFANINGVSFNKGTDYEVAGTGSTSKIVLYNSIEAGNTVEFRVIKSVIEVL